MVTKYKGEKNMKNNFIGKFFNSIGFDYEDEDEEEEIQQTERPSRSNVSNVSVMSKAYSGNKRSKVVDINTTTQFQVMVMVLERFDDVIYVSDHLKSKKPVVVNVESISDEITVQRIIDFISGVVYAIDGDMQKISKGILLVTPYTVKIMGDIKNELLTSGSFGFDFERDR